MKFSILILSLTESLNLSGEYEARTRYIQRNTRTVCDQSLLAVPFATACPDSTVSHGAVCQVKCNAGFNQIGHGNLVSFINSKNYDFLGQKFCKIGRKLTI